MAGRTFGGSGASPPSEDSIAVPATTTEAPDLATRIEPLAEARAISALQWARYGPFLSQLVIIRRCNLSCGYCSEYDKTSSPIPFDILEQRLVKIRELRSWMVCLTGGEPTLHPDLLRLVARSRELGIRRRQIITNAFRLTGKLIDGLNEAGLTDIQISLDGVRPNDTTVKVLKSVRRRLEVLSRSARFDVVLSGVIGSAPPEEALEVVRFARDHGFTPRILVLHDDTGQVTLDSRELAVYEEVKNAIGRGAREAGDYRERLIHGDAAPFKCRAGARYLYVDEHGDVHWCSQTRGTGFRKPLLDYDYDDLREQFHAPKACNPRCSVGCARSASALDNWRPQRE